MFTGNISIPAICLVLSYSCWHDDGSFPEAWMRCPTQVHRYLKPLANITTDACNTSRLLGVLVWWLHPPEGRPSAWFSCCQPKHYNRTSGCCGRPEHVYVEDEDQIRLVVKQSLPQKPSTGRPDIEFPLLDKSLLLFLVFIHVYVFWKICNRERKRKTKRITARKQELRQKTTDPTSIVLSVKPQAPLVIGKQGKQSVTKRLKKIKRGRLVKS